LRPNPSLVGLEKTLGSKLNKVTRGTSSVFFLEPGAQLPKGFLKKLSGTQPHIVEKQSEGTYIPGSLLPKGRALIKQLFSTSHLEQIRRCSKKGVFYVYNKQ